MECDVDLKGLVQCEAGCNVCQGRQQVPYSIPKILNRKPLYCLLQPRRGQEGAETEPGDAFEATEKNTKDSYPKLEVPRSQVLPPLIYQPFVRIDLMCLTGTC